MVDNVILYVGSQGGFVGGNYPLINKIIYNNTKDYFIILLKNKFLVNI